MKIVLKSLVACILIIQVLVMPVMTMEVFAAPPFDSLGSSQSESGSGRSGDKNGGSPLSPDRAEGYFVDGNGNILMNINVWGFVGRPGQVTVPEGSDISSLISLAGGPTGHYNLGKIRINRAYPDEKGKMTYLVNLNNYVKSGDRSMLIDLQPNDTVIIPENKAVDLATFLSILGLGLTSYILLTR
jgi:hypothetical protein